MAYIFKSVTFGNRIRMFPTLKGIKRSPLSLWWKTTLKNFRMKKIDFRNFEETGERSQEFPRALTTRNIHSGSYGVSRVRPQPVQRETGDDISHYKYIDEPIHEWRQFHSRWSSLTWTISHSAIFTMAVKLRHVTSHKFNVTHVSLLNF